MTQMRSLAFAVAVLMHGQEKLSAALRQAEESLINVVAVSIHHPGTAALNLVAPPHRGNAEMD